MNRITQCRPERSLKASCAALFVVLVLSVSPAFSAGDTIAKDAPDQDPEAKAILLKMAEYVAKAPAFSVTMRSEYDAIQSDGQWIEFGEKRDMVIQRPDKLRVETERSDGEQSLVVFDGKMLSFLQNEDNIFAQIDKAGTTDQVVIYLVRDLRITLPVAKLLVTNFPQLLEKQVAEISYVEENTLFDVPTDHIAVRSDQVDMQLWVAQSEQPLPRRIVLTYKNAPGAPQFRADFLGWTISPKIADDTFVFSPPAEAEQVPLLVPVRQKGSIPVQKGGEK